jgi:anti-sigma factor RsiW
MNVTREIVKDLLPLYVAGEVSADSRAAVEAGLREDKELARLADAMRDGVPARPMAAPPPSPDRAALDRIKALLRRRTWCLAFALFLTGLPLSFAFDGGGLRFLLIRDSPMVASLCVAGAAVLWVVFAATSRRLKVAGL